MSVEIIELATGGAFGAADAFIAAKVTKRLPGNLPMSVGFEAAGLLAGLWGQHIGLGRELRDPLAIGAMTMLGNRAAKLGMAGKLFTPAQWGSVGGDGDGLGGAYGMGDGYALGGGAPVAPVRNLAPGMRRIGRGGSFGLYPGTSETAGVAG